MPIEVRSLSRLRFFVYAARVESQHFGAHARSSISTASLSLLCAIQREKFKLLQTKARLEILQSEVDFNCKIANHSQYQTMMYVKDKTCRVCDMQQSAQFQEMICRRAHFLSSFLLASCWQKLNFIVIL